MEQDDSRPEQREPPPGQIRRPPLPFPLVPRSLPAVMEPDVGKLQPDIAATPRAETPGGVATVLQPSLAVLAHVTTTEQVREVVVTEPTVMAADAEPAPLPIPIAVHVERLRTPPPLAPTRLDLATPEPAATQPEPAAAQIFATAPIAPNTAVPAAAAEFEPAAVPLGFKIVPAIEAPAIEVPRPPVATDVSGPPPAVAKISRPTPRFLAVIWRGWRIVFAAIKVAAISLVVWYAIMAGLIATYRTVPPSGSALMTIRWLGGQSIDQRWQRLAEISPSLRRAVLVSEDGQFCRHKGFDFGEIRSAMKRGDGFGRGASTISQQLAKNLFLWPDRSYVRKALEVPLTITIEYLWPKSRILEVYLNVVEWGPGIFGAEAAARAYFDKPASQLSDREAALLAVALPNPLARDASAPEPLQARLATRLQSRMRSPMTFPCIGVDAPGGPVRGGAKSQR